VRVGSDARERAVELGDTAAIARCDHSLAESARRLGRFDEAIDLLQRAHDAFAGIGDEAGVADALHITGTVYAQRGDLPTARARYLDSLEIRERLVDRERVAALTNNLGIVALHTGELGLAREFGERALALYTEFGDRRRICQCEINLSMVDEAAGDHEAALGHTEKAVRLAREVGDRLTLALAQNNRGDALRELGRLVAAGEAYASALRAYRDLDDQWPMMALLEDIAALSARAGRPDEALMLAGAADSLRSSIGSARSAPDEERVESNLAAARAALGDAGAAEARERGRRLAHSQAIELALAASEASSE
jgi:tetratricopeptide (TPR) repeat protein